MMAQMQIHLALSLATEQRQLGLARRGMGMPAILTLCYCQETYWSSSLTEAPVSLLRKSPGCLSAVSQSPRPLCQDIPPSCPSSSASRTWKTEEQGAREMTSTSLRPLLVSYVSIKSIHIPSTHGIVFQTVQTELELQGLMKSLLRFKCCLNGPLLVLGISSLPKRQGYLVISRCSFMWGLTEGSKRPRTYHTQGKKS